VLSKTHKISKPNGKCEKSTCVSMGHLPKLEKPKIENGEDDGATA